MELRVAPLRSKVRYKLSEKEVQMLRAARLALPLSMLVALPAAGQSSAPGRVEKDTPSATPAGATVEEKGTAGKP